MANPELAPGALVKPIKGSSRAARVAARIAEERHEDREKTKARKRDLRCRWPGCDCQTRRDRIEVAHIEDKSLLGPSDSENLVCLCVARHQGRPSLHSKDLRIEKLTPAGADGPLSFWARDYDGSWYCVALESAPFLYVRY
jgi:hypothetical protein